MLIHDYMHTATTAHVIFDGRSMPQLWPETIASARRRRPRRPDLSKVRPELRRLVEDMWNVYDRLTGYRPPVVVAEHWKVPPAEDGC